MYHVTQDDLLLLQQSIKNIYTKIELLNHNFTILDELQGYVTGGSITISADSDIRRICNLTIIVTDKSLLRGPDKKIWMNKYIRIYIGFQGLRDNNIHYYNQGIFLFGEHNFDYDATTNTLSLTCYDLMSRLTGLRNGQLQGLLTKIPVDTKIRDAMVSTVTQLGGFSKYLIYDNEKTVPYDLEFNTGDFVYSILKELCNLYPGYEFFFDTDGTFIFQKIPTADKDPYILDEHTLSSLVVKETIGSTFTTIKNATEVWGKCLKEDRYTDKVAMTGVEYALTIENFQLTDDKKIPNHTTIAFKASADNLAEATIKVNDVEAAPIVDSAEKPIEANKILASKSYLVKFSKGKFILLGQWQIHGVALLYNKERTPEEQVEDKKRENCDNIKYMINPENPFAIDALGEEIRQIKHGGEYEKIYSDDLAMQRAEYDTWLATRCADSITLELHMIPWLNVNQKIQYRSKETGEVQEYLIKDISLDFGNGTMGITCSRFYPLYPFIVKEENAAAY